MLKFLSQLLKSKRIRPTWDYEVSDIFGRICENCREYNESILGVKCAFMCHGCKKVLKRPDGTKMLNPYVNIDGLLIPISKQENNNSTLKAFICIS